jgi:hypothetical protein
MPTDEEPPAASPRRWSTPYTHSLSDHGTGTFYYGAADKRPDGSQVATLFVILFFLPLLPLGTHRIRKSDIKGGRMTIQRLERLLLRWSQILLTYLKCWVLLPGLLFASLPLFLLATRHQPKINQTAGEIFIWSWVIYTMFMAAYCWDALAVPERSCPR